MPGHRLRDGRPRGGGRVIDHLAPLGKVFYIHFRDVKGQVPAFAECFLGEGNLDVR